MTPTRANELLAAHRVMGSLPFAWSETVSESTSWGAVNRTGASFPFGITREEDKAIRLEWCFLPGQTYIDAIRVIALKGNTCPPPPPKLK